MAASNFQQWNPSQTNQLSDSAYTSDTSRSGGAGTTAVFPSATANKLFYQLTTFIAAFGAMMAQKGFDNSDASLGALQAVLANLITTADQRIPLVTVGYAASLVLDFSNCDGFEITLTGDVTSSSFAGLSPGRIITCVFIQDAMGNHAFAWPTGGAFPVNAAVVSSPDPGAGSTSIQRVLVLADNSIHPITPMVVS